MNVSLLDPKPTKSEVFRRNRERFFPDTSGCYVLSTFDGTVLYVGLAKNIRRRLNQHLDNVIKVEATPIGRATLVHWLETHDINTVERTWMNIHLLSDGKLPIFNKVYSPTAT